MSPPAPPEVAGGGPSADEAASQSSATLPPDVDAPNGKALSARRVRVAALMGSTSLGGDPEEAVHFLKWLRPGGHWVLTAIPPEGGRTTTATFKPGQEKALRAWLQERIGRLNIYFQVNPARTDLVSKAKKEDVEALEFLHVDVDPAKGMDLDKERQRILPLLEEFDPKPSAIIDSGGGFQAFWRLDEQLYLGGDPTRVGDAEAYNRQLEAVLNGDHCHNVDRIMRLPGTVNLPNAKKREKGRVASMASVVYTAPEGERVYGLGEFAAAKAEVAPAPKRGKASKTSRRPPRLLLDIAELDRWSVSALARTLIVQGHDPERPDRYPSRSEPVWAVLCECVRRGVPDDLVVGIITDERWRISFSVREKKDSLGYAWKQVEAAHNKVAGEPAAKPRIHYAETELPRVLDEAEQAMIDSGFPIYQMSGRLVRPVRLDPAAGGVAHGHEAGPLVIRDLPARLTRELQISAATFFKRVQKGASCEEVELAPPMALADHYHARAGDWRVRRLFGIAEAPTLRPDGTVLEADGYDPASHLLLDKQGIDYPAVPKAPTKEMAEQALAKLGVVLAGFPFDGAQEDGRCAARSVALSCLLTSVSRRAMRTAPLHGISAPTMGTGKSLLADAAAILATGRTANVMSQGKSEEEDEKRLLSVLSEGPPIVVIDNVERPISGDALCAILTSEKWQSRKLGESTQITVSTSVLMVATGNNLAFQGDMSTRALVCSLDAGVEQPEKRSFKVDLRKYVQDNRPQLVVAALTVVRAYIVAGRPGAESLERFGRFEDWSNLVRGALVWLGEADPCETRELIEQRDTVRDDLGALIEAWRVAIGPNRPVTAATVIAQADEGAGPGGPSQLSNALHCICTFGVTPKALARFLSKVDKRLVGGLRLRRIHDRKNGSKYVLEGAQPGVPGVSGDFDRPEPRPQSLFEPQRDECPF